MTNAIDRAASLGRLTNALAEQLDRKPVCYIAGPMRGCEDFNYPAFNRAATVLRLNGWIVFNPAETDKSVQTEADVADNPLKVYMQQDLVDVCRSDVVFVLDGWEESKGASLEVHVAHGVGVEVIRYRDVTKVAPPTASAPPVHPPAGETGGRSGQPTSLDFGPSWRAVDPDTGGMKGRKQATFAHEPLIADVLTARVTGMGLMKYPDEGSAPNWSKGMPWSWLYDAMRRHIASAWAGDDIDPESGLPNLAHARWMLDKLIEYGWYGLGTDDRPKWRNGEGSLARATRAEDGLPESA